MTVRLAPEPPERPEPPEPAREFGGPPALQRHDAARFRAAALHARRIYPGLLGELVFRELTAYAEFGYRFSDDALIPRLAAQVLATPTPSYGTPA